jgi:hypothetical protein
MSAKHRKHGPRPEPACQVASDCNDWPAEGLVDMLVKPHPGRTAFHAVIVRIRSANRRGRDGRCYLRRAPAHDTTATLLIGPGCLKGATGASMRRPMLPRVEPAE